MKFIKPKRSIVEKSGWLYNSPVGGIVYWSRLKSVFDYLKHKRWGLILEIGCKYGFFLPSLCQISDKVIGSDIEETFNFCEKTSLRELKKDYTNLELRKVDARNLSDYIREGSCDVIIAISVLEHIHNYNEAIKEICKCLKPDGIFVCVLPSENWLYKLGRRVIGYRGDYHKHYNYEKLRANLCRNLKEVKKWSCPFGIPLFFAGVYVKKKD